MVKKTIVFIKKIGRYFAELTQTEENGKIILHKSFFNQKKEPYAKLQDVKSKTSSEGGDTSISHTDNTVPAISLESRDDVMKETDDSVNLSDSKDTTNSEKVKSLEQENTNATKNKMQNYIKRNHHLKPSPFKMNIYNPPFQVMTLQRYYKVLYYQRKFFKIVDENGEPLVVYHGIEKLKIVHSL